MTFYLVHDIGIVSLKPDFFGELNEENRAARFEFTDDAELLAYSVGRASA
jgi:hypothetical protein